MHAIQELENHDYFMLFRTTSNRGEKMTKLTINDLDKLQDFMDNVIYKIEDIIDEIEELKKQIQISEEIENFLYDLQDNDNLPEYIRNNAGDLWKNI